jgi:hypothetical protein
MGQSGLDGARDEQGGERVVELVDVVREDDLRRAGRLGQLASSVDCVGPSGSSS